jgi:hypothetical protein
MLIYRYVRTRSVESGRGVVTCLPGALTVLRCSVFRKMAKYYFADKTEQCEDLFDFRKCHRGGSMIDAPVRDRCEKVVSDPDVHERILQRRSLGVF